MCARSKNAGRIERERKQGPRGNGLFRFVFPEAMMMGRAFGTKRRKSTPRALLTTAVHFGSEPVNVRIAPHVCKRMWSSETLNFFFSPDGCGQVGLRISRTLSTLTEGASVSIQRE